MNLMMQTELKIYAFDKKIIIFKVCLAHANSAKTYLTQSACVVLSTPASTLHALSPLSPLRHASVRCYLRTRTNWIFYIF